MDNFIRKEVKPRVVPTVMLLGMLCPALLLFLIIIVLLSLTFRDKESGREGGLFWAKRPKKGEERKPSPDDRHEPRKGGDA